jgi:predicted ATPase/class 3 adenylate cyclase/DNA-binding CsgD family transcriptional regulator
MRQGVELPKGTVTLLLGDVEDSTRLWERSSDQARSAMAELDSFVDEYVAKFDGARPVEQGEGDSFVAGFWRASDAVSCAIELQRTLAEMAIRVRMAIHTGEIEIRDGSRYDGSTIIRCARVRDLGHGGQVLVSSSTRDLAHDALPDGVDLVDLGSHPLKGLDRAERVFQLTHPDLEGRFPPLRALEAVKGNLPVRLTSFIGRTTELADVQRLVASDRLVTITGAGGCGKTRLAVEALEPLSEGFDDGIWFCDLGPLADPEMVAQALRVSLNLRDESSRSDLQVVCDYLGDKRALVVIDNCEHLVDASAELVDALLRACPEVRILATTREPLGVEGEVSWRVPSLPPVEAIELFVERAARVRPNFRIGDENRGAITEICERLDGIPLAIELAAARVRSLSIRQILDGLGDRFRLLGRGSRTLLARQQTLLASVGWSHDLLDNAQRAVMRRASVFAGGFTLEAAERIVVLDDVEPHEILEVVSQLVDRSLLVAEENEWGTRYRMLETIRQFARDRLVDSGEAADVARAHLDHFTDWVRRKGLAVQHGGGREHAHEVDADYDNIRVAIEWSLMDSREDRGLQLMGALWHVVVTRRTGAILGEAEGWLIRLLDAREGESIDRAMGLIALAWIRSFKNDQIGGVIAATEALPLVREIGDPSLLARTLVILGCVTSFVDRELGMSQLLECEALARETDDMMTLSICRFLQATTHLYSGHLLEALEVAEDAERLGLIANNPNGGVMARAIRGLAIGLQGQVRQGAALLEEATESFVDMRNPWWTVVSTGMRAWVAQCAGQREEALRLLRRSAEIAEHLGLDIAFGVQVEATEALFALYEGDAGPAERLPDERLALPGWMGDGTRGAIEATKGVALALRGSEREGLTIARNAVHVIRESRFMFPMLTVFPPFAMLLRRQGELTEAEQIVDELRVFVESNRLFSIAPEVLRLAGALRADVGASADAVRLFGAAHSESERLGIASPPPSWLFDVSSEIDTARAALGDEAFDDAWKAGSALSVEDALAFAGRGRGPRERPQAGWDAVTPMEHRVIELVAEGLTNPQIAERLFVSRRTVSTHLSHVFAKLGVSSRAELAAAVTRRSLDT